MQKKIVILGGVGLVGGHLARRLLEQGNEVYVVDTREPCSSPLLRELEPLENFHFVRHNIISPFTIRCDELYNLCGPTRLGHDKQPPVETLKTHLQGSINTLENARSEFSRVLYASSSAIYASHPSLQFDPHNERAATAEGVRGAEMLHRAYFSEYGIDCRIARLFNLYGSGADLNDRRVVMRMVVAALQQRDITICGNGEQLRTFLWVEDAVEGLIRLMRADASHFPLTVDFGGAQEISIRHLAEKIISLCGSRSKILHTESRHGEERRRVADLEVGRRLIGWYPRTSLGEGLKRLIEYVEQELSAFRHGSRSWIEIYG